MQTLKDGDLLLRVNKFEEWAYENAPENPKMVEIILVTRKLSQALMSLKFIHEAIKKSPRRNVSGKGGVYEIFGGKMPRSTIYKILENMGFTGNAMDAFRTCRTMEEVIEKSPCIQGLKKKFNALYEKYMGENAA